MIKIIKKFLVTAMVAVTVSFGAGVLSPTPVVAAGCVNQFLTFRPWYTGLVLEPDCRFKKITESGGGDTITLTAFVWVIILNILNILFGVVGYLALGFIIYGGYLYVLARGDATRVAKGKRTVMSAVIGLIICILASLIANTIVTILTGATKKP